MKLKDLKNLDLYTCSLQDLNKSYKVCKNTLLSMASKGLCNSDSYKEIHSIYILISRARLGMDSNGYMLSENIDLNRVANSSSIL